MRAYGENVVVPLGNATIRTASLFAASPSSPNTITTTTLYQSLLVVGWGSTVYLQPLLVLLLFIIVMMAQYPKTNYMMLYRTPLAWCSSYMIN